MADVARTRYVAECFWAGVQERDLRELDRRIEASTAVTAATGAATTGLGTTGLGTTGLGTPVRYLGWLLVRDDEVVLVIFEGSIGTVRRVAEHARVPFERLLQVSYAPRPNQIADEEVPE